MTKLYLRNTTDAALSAYVATEKSTRTPACYSDNQIDLKKDLSLTKGTTQTSASGTNSNHTTLGHLYWGKWISAPLTVTTINANTWTFACAASENNVNANQFISLAIYVLTSGDTIRGTIYDATTALGTELIATEEGRVVTVSGAQVTGVQSTDRLCVEWWFTGTPAKTNAYTQTIYYDGATDPTNAVATSDAATYISTPQDIIAAAAVGKDLRLDWNVYQLAGKDLLARWDFEGHGPQFITATNVFNNSVSATTTGDLTGIPDGAFMQAHFISSDTEAGASLTSAPAGWTEKKAFGFFGTGADGVWWRIKQAGDSNPSWVLSGARDTHVNIRAYSGVNATTPYHDFQSANKGSSTNTVVAPDITTTINNCRIVRCYADKATTSTAVTEPALHTNVSKAFGSGASTVSVLSLDQPQDTAGATGTATAVWDAGTPSSNGRAYTIALAPAAAPVGKSLVVSWDVYQLAGKSMQANWDVYQLAGKNVQASWDVYQLAGKNLILTWDVFQLAAKNLIASWDVYQLAGGDTTFSWNTYQLAGKNLRADWDVYQLAGKALILAWDVWQAAGKNLVLTWDVESTGTAVGKSLILSWDVHQLAGKDLVISWNVFSLVSKDLVTSWHVYGIVGKNVVFTWNIYQIAGKNLVITWHVGNVGGIVFEIGGFFQYFQNQNYKFGVWNV